MDETKVIYHIDDEETPYLVKIPIAPDRVTLADFKNVLNRPNFKFFFKSMDVDFGVVKEEIVEDCAHLPCFNGRVVSWLVSADGSNQSDGGSQCTDTTAQDTGMILPRPQQADSLLCTDTESIISSRQGAPPSRKPGKYLASGNHRLLNGHHHLPKVYESNSMLSSDLESTSFQSETTGGRHTALSECSSISRLHVANRKRPQRRRKQRPQAMSRTSSYSSITDSTMSMNIITVTLNMETANFLGISIVGQSSKGGDGGIYVGSIMKGGAVALDGRIEPGDMILQVNDVNFENMTNDEAVRVLREVVQKPGPIKLVVAKCWDPNPKGYFTIPRTEPVRPIDPGAWVAHTAAVQADQVPRPPSSSTTLSSASITSTIPAQYHHHQQHLLQHPPPGLEDDVPLTVSADMGTVVRCMSRPDSGLEIRDRLWLKITIPNAFIGADVVDWLLANVDGFVDRRDARKYASQLLKAGFIRHTVNKITFSEQCYYIFGDICSAMSSMKLRDATAGGDCDSVGPLPVAGPNYMPYAGTYNPLEYQPMPFYNTSSEHTLYGYNREESIISGSGGSSNGSDPRKDAEAKAAQQQQHHSSASESDMINLGAVPPPRVPPLPPLHPSNNGGRRSRSSGSEASSGTQVATQTTPTTAAAAAQENNLAGSRQSFKIAMGNPCELFVDVM